MLFWKEKLKSHLEVGEESGEKVGIFRWAENKINLSFFRSNNENERIFEMKKKLGIQLEMSEHKLFSTILIVISSHFSILST